jgi:multiple sugar transport system substrate-binding protein
MPSALTRRSLLRGGTLPLLGLATACRRLAPSPAGQPAPEAPPVTLTYLNDLSGEGAQLERELFDRFTAENPKITIEVVPNAQNQPSRVRVVVLHAAGTPADFFTSSRAAYADLMINGVIESLSPYVQHDKFDFAKMFLADHVDHITFLGKIWGWPITVSADALAYNLDIFDANGLPYPPLNPEDKSWTMEKFLEIARRLTRGVEQFGFGGTRNGFPLLADGTFFGQGPWDGKERCLFDSPKWIQAEEYWVSLIWSWHVTPQPHERSSIIVPGKPIFFSGKIGMDVISGLPPRDVEFRWALSTLPYSGEGSNVSGRLGLHSFHMGQGKHKDRVWEVFRWFSKKENAGSYPITWGHSVTPMLEATEIAQDLYRRRYGVDPKAFALQARHSKRSGWGLQNMVEWWNVEQDVRKLYDAMFANELSPAEYGARATPLVNEAIRKSLAQLPK